MHPAGDLTHRDLVTILPMLDETVVIQVSGEALGCRQNGAAAPLPARLRLASQELAAQVVMRLR